MSRARLTTESLMEMDPDGLAITGSGGTRAASWLYGEEQERDGGRAGEIVGRSWRGDSRRLKTGGIIKSAMLWRRSRSGRVSGSSSDISDRGYPHATGLMYSIGIPRSASADIHPTSETVEPREAIEVEERVVEGEIRTESLPSKPKTEADAAPEAVATAAAADISSRSCGSTTPCSSPGVSRRRSINSSGERPKISSFPSSYKSNPQEDACRAEAKQGREDIDAAAGEAILEALRVCGPKVDPALAPRRCRRPLVSAVTRGNIGATGKEDEEEVAAAVAAALAWSPSHGAEQRWDETIEEVSCEGDEDGQSTINIGGDMDPQSTCEGARSRDGVNLGECQSDITNGTGSSADNDLGNGNGNSGEEEDEEDSVGSREGSVLTFGDLVKRSSLERLEAQRLALTSSPSPTDSGSAPGASWMERDTAILLRSIGAGQPVDWPEHGSSLPEFHTRGKGFASADIGAGTSAGHARASSKPPSPCLSAKQAVGGPDGLDGGGGVVDGHHPVREELGARVLDAPANGGERGVSNADVQRGQLQRGSHFFSTPGDGKANDGLLAAIDRAQLRRSPRLEGTLVGGKERFFFSTRALSPRVGLSPCRTRSPSVSGPTRDAWKGDWRVLRTLRRASSCALKNNRVGDEGEPPLLDEGPRSDALCESALCSASRKMDIERMSTSSGLEEDEEIPRAAVRVGAMSPGSSGNNNSASPRQVSSAPIPYRRLAGVGRQWPRGVNPASREEWLSPDEFAAVFGMSYGNFKRLPWWRRRILKQEVELF